MEQIRMVQVELLHPHEKNPRIDAASVTDLVESIREHGIEVPLVVVPPYGDGDDKGWVVVAGHRRLTAAIEVGLAEVPVQVRADLMSKVEQLAFMATENLHRDQLTAVEESRLVQDMLELGLSQAEVVKQTALGKKRVSERAQLGKLADKTGDKMHRGQITVEDALLIAEYSDDPGTAETLEQWVGTSRFDYEVSAARRRRADKKQIAAAGKQMKKEGLRQADGVVRLEELVSAGHWATPALEEAAATASADEEWSALLRSEHESCPGHSAVIVSEAKWITGLGHVEAGTVIVGCDQHEKLHPAPDTDTAEQPEPEKDPWEELDSEAFATAKIHRERHLHKTLPGLDLEDAAHDIAVDSALQMGWGQYYDNDHGIALLEGITGAAGKAKVRKVLQGFPMAVLVWIGHHEHTLKMHHRFMAQGHPGSSYWDAKATFRQLLELTGYEWTDVEQQAILLATGIPHDATDDEADGAEADGAALAEGGEVA